MSEFVVFTCMHIMYTVKVLYPVCVSDFVFQCVCSPLLMTHDTLSCRQAESEEGAVFVISAGCHSHGAFGCCHHRCNYNASV